MARSVASARARTCRNTALNSQRLLQVRRQRQPPERVPAVRDHGGEELQEPLDGHRPASTITAGSAAAAPAGRPSSIIQAKTGRVLTLPLVPDVADALIAYLRNGRPATPSRHVFVRHKAPFEPFVAANNLATIMRQALQRVGLDQREGRRGLYLLRHTLASRMLASGNPLKRIGDVLGHASADTTMEYASVDLTTLRRVAISEAEVRP